MHQGFNWHHIWHFCGCEAIVMWWDDADVHVFGLIWLQEGFAFAHCTECRASFHLQTNMPPDRWWLRLKFQLLVVRDHALLFIVVQMVRIHGLRFPVVASFVYRGEASKGFHSLRNESVVLGAESSCCFWTYDRMSVSRLGPIPTVMELMASVGKSR